MIVYCELELRLPMARSLKDKRSILKSLSQKLDNKFNIALAEMDSNDLWKTSLLGIVSVSSSRAQLESTINRVIDFVDDFSGVMLVNYTLDYY